MKTAMEGLLTWFELPPTKRHTIRYIPITSPCSMQMPMEAVMEMPMEAAIEKPIEAATEKCYGIF